MSQEDSPKILLLVIVGIIIPLSIIFFGNIGRILTKFGRILTGSANKPVQIEWQRCLGGVYKDIARSIQQTKDGGYIVAGYTYSGFVRMKGEDVRGNHGEYDFWVVKLDKNGNIEWKKCLGGSDKDYVYSIQQTIDGGYIVAGYTFSDDGNVRGNHGQEDFWVVKLDEEGNIEWQKCLGGSDTDEAYSIQQTDDGGYIVAGKTSSNDGDVSGNHGYTDFWVVKLDSNGNIEWQKCYGGSEWDEAHSIQQTDDGGYIVAGKTSSNDGDVSGWHEGYNFGLPEPDFWVVKLDNEGNIEWQKVLGGSGWDLAYSVQQTDDGGYIVAGETWSDDGDVNGYHGYTDSWIVKLDPNGNMEWQRCLGGSSEDVAYSIQQTSDGGYIVAGYTWSNDGDVSKSYERGDFWVVKLDEEGNMEWQECLGGSGDDGAFSIQQTDDGGYIVAGWTYSNDGDVSGWHEGYDNGISLEDFWVVKLK